MTAHELPENYHQWPTDPHALLGVSETADERTLKRAYTQLIRKYKPEHSPEEFKRVRAAYEAALLQCEYRARFQKLSEEHSLQDLQELAPEILEDADQADSREPAPQPDSGESSYLVHPPTFAKPESPTRGKDLSQDAWELVQQGKPVEALAQLKEWEQTLLQPQQNSWLSYGKLYWLAKAFPELKEDGVGWLHRAMRKLENTGGLLELFRRESVHNPEVVLTEELGKVFERTPTFHALLPLADVRWNAAAKLGRHQQIFQDLERMRGRFAFDEELLWGRVLIQAIECLITAEFSRPFEVQAANRQHFLRLVDKHLDELKPATHLHKELENELDRLDFLRQFLSALHYRSKFAIGPVLTPWIAFINRYYFVPPEESDSLIPKLVQELVSDPVIGIAELDMILSEQTLISPVIHILQRYLQLRDYQTPEETVELVPVLPAITFVEDQDAYPNSVRPYLIRLCFQEAISPSDAVAALKRSRTFNWDLEGWVEQDRVLHYVFWAWVAFYQ